MTLTFFKILETPAHNIMKFDTKFFEGYSVSSVPLEYHILNLYDHNHI